MGNRLAGKRVFITQSNAYMGPAIEALFSGEGAIVSAKPGRVTGRFSEASTTKTYLFSVSQKLRNQQNSHSFWHPVTAISSFGQVVPFSGGWVTTT